MKTQGEDSDLQPRREAAEETNTSDNFILDFHVVVASLVVEHRLQDVQTSSAVAFGL